MSDESDHHFLVVDDDRDSRSTIAEYLRSMGYNRITLAEDGADALAALGRDPSVDFIISDWDMPMVNGLSLLQRVKADPARAHLPFLIVTSPISEEAEKVVLAAENLVDAYVIKPFRSHVLEEKIRAVFSSPARGMQKQAVVVDDDADARAMVIEYLSTIGFKNVLGIADGRSALTHLKENAAKVGLVVSDWEMPEVNGLELLKACKSSTALSKIPFLMITSQSSIERMKVMQAARSKVDEYLLKPFTVDQIRQRVEDALTKVRNRGAVELFEAEAADHLEHGRYQRAEEKYQELLKLDPTHDSGLLGMAEAVFKQRGVEAALPWYKKAVTAAPTVAKAYVKLANAYEQVSLIDPALALLQGAIQQIAFSAELHFYLGRLYNKKGMIPQARAEFEKTLEIQLDHQEARLMLVMIGQGPQARKKDRKKD